jgi:hypothetical protein
MGLFCLELAPAFRRAITVSQAGVGAKGRTVFGVLWGLVLGVIHEKYQEGGFEPWSVGTRGVWTVAQAEQSAPPPILLLSRIGGSVVRQFVAGGILGVSKRLHWISIACLPRCCWLPAGKQRSRRHSLPVGLKLTVVFLFPVEKRVPSEPVGAVGTGR